MIKVFTSSVSPDNNEAGIDFTKMIELWINGLATKIQIKNIHTNSNEYGWMVIIHYELW
jgi:hypothetical protein